MGKFFSKAQLTQSPNAPLEALGLLSHNELDIPPPPPPAALTPGLGKNSDGRQDPSPPRKGGHGEAEGHLEGEDNMSLGIRPPAILRLTPSRIQHLAFGELLCYQELLHPQITLKDHSTDLRYARGRADIKTQHTRPQL